METETKNQVATVFSEQLLTTSVQTVLSKANGIEAIKATIYSDADRAALIPIASARPPAIPPIKENDLRQALAGLAHMPHRDSGELGGKIMLAAYKSRLGTLPAEAVYYACRAWLDTEKWFPAISQLKALAAEWVSPEQKTINRAQFILRWGGRPREPLPPPDDAERRAFNSQMRRIGCDSRYFSGEAEPRPIAQGEAEPECDPDDLELAEDLRGD